MIQVSEVREMMDAALDAEGSDRYLFDQDHKHAINDAITWMTSLFSSALERKKISPENLRELLYTRVFQPNVYGRIELDPNELGQYVFYIVAVNPEAEVHPSGSTLDNIVDTDSKYRDDLTFVKSDFSAANLPYEEWNQNRKNIFKKGNDVLTGEMKSYAYLNFGNYGSTSYDRSMEIEVRPNPHESFVGITYVKRPDKINNESDTIEFPYAVINLVYQRALHFISYKQGDQTNLFSVTQNDVNTLAQLLS